MNEFEVLLQKLIDGTITPYEFSQFETEMLANPEARELYYSYIQLHQGLDFRLAGANKPNANQAGGMLGLAELRLQRQRRKAMKVAAFATAALIVISCVMMYYTAVQNMQNRPLNFAISPGASYELAHVDASQSTKMQMMHIGSKMEIFQGSVELQFASGVRSIVSGPAEIVLKDHETLQMERGRAWFDVPKKAVGFTVESKELKVVDLGTKFGVYADPVLSDEVHVFEGEVAVSTVEAQDDALVLVQGEAAMLLENGTLDKISSLSDQFLVELPDQLPFLHFSFDESLESVSANTLSGAPMVDAKVHGEQRVAVDGKFGKAIQLDGKSNFLETNWPGVLGEAPRTVSFWIKMPNRRELEVGRSHISAVAWGRQFRGDQNNKNTKWTVHFDAAPERPPMLNISFGGFWYFCPESVIDDDKWHHMVAVFTGKYVEEGIPEVIHYLDGESLPLYPAEHEPVLRDNDGRVSIDTQAEHPLQMGSWAGDTADGPHFLEATMDELYIIEGAIDHKAVKKLMEENILDVK